MRAFKLAAHVKEEGFSGGTVSYGPAQTAFDIGEAITENGKLNLEAVIVAEAPSLIEALAQYPGLEEAEVPTNAAPVEAPGEAEPVATSSVGEIPQSPPVNQVEVTPAPPADRISPEQEVAADHIEGLDETHHEEDHMDESDLGIR